MAVLDLSAPGGGKDTVIPIHRLNTTKNNEHLIHSQDVEMRTLTYRDKLNLSDNINHNITTEERKPEQKIGENTTEGENKKRLSAKQRHLKEHVNSTTKSTNYTIGISEQIYFKDINIPQMSKDKKIVTVYSPNTSNAFNINMDKKRIRDYHISQLQCTLPSITAHNIDTYVEKQARIFQQQVGPMFPANTRRWANVVLMLAQRRKRRVNIKPALAQCLVFAGLSLCGSIKYPW